MMENRNKSSLSDIPFNEEKNDFGTERYVNGLIKFIKNSSAPITIALQGEWGSGKTSLMTRLERDLCSPDAPYIGIGINTWEYSMLASPEETVFKIIERLVKDLSDDNQESKNTWNKFINKFKHAAFRGARETAKLVPGVGIVIEAANVPTDLKDDTPEQEDTTLSDLKKSLEDSVRNIVQKRNKQGVIVFVDDLDRLNPPVAVEILELLKNIFCINDCIFVLAIDYEVVVKGLEPKFGKLTDENEREFRSFFDKIIQVPFSLPVSSYRPMNFVLDALVNVGYISEVEKGDDRIHKPFAKIVEYSVGKNPRSIKRLVNTLSLLSCIAQSGDDDNKAFTDSREGRIANFAIVALQVCYPKIYRIVSYMPDFTKWDSAICSKFNINIGDESGETPDWEEILQAACSTDNYLSQHYIDIRNLLTLVQETIMDEGDEDETKFEECIRTIIDKSSVTGLSEPVSESETNEKLQKRLIDTLHRKIGKRIKEMRPQIKEIRAKRNTGRGGFHLFYDGGKAEIIFRPKVRKSKISLEIILPTAKRRPNHLIGKTFDEMMQDIKVKTALEDLDKCIAPLLKDAYYFEGRTYSNPGPGTYFKSFTEEQAFRCNQGWIPEHISQDTSYWINFPKESLFSDKAVIETIAEVIVATCDYKLS